MDQQQITNPHIVGLTGSFGSGCTYVLENILSKKGYTTLSLSTILKEMYGNQTGEDPAKATRRELQDFGDKVRNNEGPGFFAHKLVERIEGDAQKHEERKWVVDSIRNPAEVRVLRDCSRRFFLFGLYADKDVRWTRVEQGYQGDRKAFDEDDRNDIGEESPEHGQRVADCFAGADVVLSNNKQIAAIGNADFLSLAGRIKKYADLVAKPLTRAQPVRKQEPLMAMAYAASQQSSCLKRKVGAIIVDALGNVISSGFNEVPMHEKPCAEEYLACYRDRAWQDFVNTLNKTLGRDVAGGKSLTAELRKELRMLDYCRALHAEENAILNLARNGPSLERRQCTLYTTTYPCRLCANKIVTVGINHIVYLEPYPDPEAKVILRNGGVRDEFFQGVTFKSYFRIYGEDK